LTPENLDLIAGWASLVLTLLVFSYLLGDNVLYRLAVHVLVGVAAAYIAIVATESVLVPWFRATVTPWIDVFLRDKESSRDNALIIALAVVGMVPFLIGVLLMFKSRANLAPIGNLGLALVIGTGVAVALVGAIAGTVVPLARDAGESVDENAVDGVVIVLGTITTLMYFQYLAVQHGSEIQRARPPRALSGFGQFFVTLTLGAIYGGAILTSLTIFSDVIRKQLEFILNKVGG
jgi:hypothetical protein